MKLLINKNLIFVSIFFLVGCSNQDVGRIQLIDNEVEERVVGGGDKPMVQDGLGGVPVSQDYIIKADDEFNNNKDYRFINVIARSWEFDPVEIIVKRGEKVILLIKSEDVEHGVYIPDFEINEVIRKGETASIELRTDKVGIFEFSCSVYCGEGHSRMNGKIIVSE